MLVDRQMRDVRNALLPTFPLSLTPIALGSWYVPDHALSPIRRLTATIRGVTVQGLNRNLSDQDGDLELSQPIEASDGMLERLERSYRQASRFSSDAEHELLTLSRADAGRLALARAPFDLTQALAELAEDVHSSRRA